ncbi:MAG TPA: 2-(1,2-epoxy-1,2-dihydrophenyl)acetyl-CoA isomerase PaaG [Bryobacteraceae bacterium]|jgi:2-(1,2-epoxy-1,2-dihydrophenyl)acetyl-CoA isomerase|nr:2-(1,2-epoxy-1,2-dihydrophenyl)acetyl-CoA isomerase PaaG [Bryobacteraceae bacterium]
MTFETILFEVARSIARLTLNRPEKLNSFTRRMHAEIRQALYLMEETRTARVLIITGEGRGFCAGQDLSEDEADLGAAIERDYAPLVRRLRALPIPVVAAVNGVAAGAGANLALACDVVIATKSASFIQSFSKVGLMPDTGGTYFLPRLAGTARAMGLALFAERISAQQAADWGLIWRCVDDDCFAKTVEDVLNELAYGPTKAFARIKQAMYASTQNSLEKQLMLERDFMRKLGHSRDYREGVAAFLGKRAPQFRGE